MEVLRIRRRPRQSPNAAFTEEGARHIKLKLCVPKAAGGDGVSVAEAAQMYDVSPETIRRLLRGETYKNLPEGAQNLHYGEEIQAKAAQSVEELRKILEADGLAPKEVGEEEKPLDKGTFPQ